MIAATAVNMTQETLTLEQIWIGVRQGSAAMQRQLYHSTYKLMMGICCRYALTVEDAEQWVHDGYVKIFNNSEKYGDKGSLEGWLKRIMVNTCLDNLRATKAQYNAPHLFTKETTAIGQDYSTANNALLAIEANDLLQLVNQLPSTHRTVFNMYAVDGFSHKEIATHLGIKEANSQWYLNQARNTLKTKLEKYNFKGKIERDEQRTI
jgi:RNA polymerase sigma factor (sigma-70 family)